MTTASTPSVGKAELSRAVPAPVQAMAGITLETWTNRYGMRPSKGRPCPHLALYGRCTQRQCDVRDGHRPDFLDHVRSWIDPAGRIVLLAHVYDWDLEKESDAAIWATRYGLSWAILLPDGWYGHGTTPIRFWLERQT